MPFRSLTFALLITTSACFSEASGSASVDGSDGAPESDTSASPPDTSSSPTIADTTTDACTDLVFENIPVEAHPVELFVLVAPGTDPTTLNAALLAEDFIGFAGATGLRTVVIDPMLGIAALPEACNDCSVGVCSTAINVVIGEDVTPFSALFDPDLYECVLQSLEDEPRRRLLFLTPGPDVDDETMANVQLLATDPLWDIDVGCPGCTAETPGLPAAIAAAGGVVADLDDFDLTYFTLLSSAAPPPRCGWPIFDPIDTPFTLGDLSVNVDSCIDAPCPFEIDQVSGIGTCDADDPSANEFFVLEDAIAEGTSLAGLCAPVCARLRRAFSEAFVVTHTYRCPS